jgi:gluconokinase
MQDYLIGIDIGTGSVKALAIDRSGILLSSAQQSYPMIQSNDDSCEQDPTIIWSAFAYVIASLTKQLNANPVGVSLSSAMHSLIILSASDELIGNMITWADNRAGKVAEKLRLSPKGEMLYEQTGAPVHAMTPLCKITWLKENKPDVFSHAARFISIKEYVWWKLFGEFEVDYSIAGASGLFDIESLDWNENALNFAGIQKQNLSRIVNTNFTRSRLSSSATKKTGLNADTTFVIGSSDGCMANLGSFATKPGVAALTIGTSGALRVASDHPVHNFRGMTFNYRLDEKTFICGGPTNNGGVVLKWYAESFLKKKLATNDDYTSLLADIDQIAPCADGLIFLPYILGERAPIWNSNACGVFFGIKKSHTQAHFTRAVLEGISFALFNIAEKILDTGTKVEQINVSGGFVHSATWLKIIASVFGKKLTLMNTSDASALGAAFLGLKTLKMINSYDELHRGASKEVLPDDTSYTSYQKLQPVMDGEINSK